MKSSVPSKQAHPTSAGLTLFEAVITIGIIGFLFSLSALGASQTSKRLLIGPSDGYLESIFMTASRRARDGVEGSAWGVYLPYDEQSRKLNEVLVFKGLSYASRDSIFDQTFSFSEHTEFVTVDFSGVAPDSVNDHEVVFERYSGETAMYGSVELEVFGEIRSVTISEEGFVTREL